MQYFFVTKNKQRENEKNELKTVQKREFFIRKQHEGEWKNVIIKKKQLLKHLYT